VYSLVVVVVFVVVSEFLISLKIRIVAILLTYVHLSNKTQVYISIVVN